MVNNNHEIFITTEPEENTEIKNITYYQAHKNEILLQKKQYYLVSRDKLLKKTKCECGAIVSVAGYRRHLLSLKHKKFIDSNSKNTDLQTISENLTSPDQR